MKKLFFITLFVFIAVPLFAQTGWGGAATMGRLDRAADRNNWLTSDPTIDEIKGSPFYYEEWKKGEMISKSGEVSNLYYLKYVILTNNILLQKNGVVYRAKPEFIKGFTLIQKGGKAIFKKGFSSDKYDIRPTKYLKIMYDGKLKLVADYEIDRDIKTELRTGKKTLYLETDKWYYIVTPDGVFHEVDLEKDDILEVLPRNGTELEEYVEKLNLDYSNTKHLQKILSIYEQLNF